MRGWLSDFWFTLRWWLRWRTWEVPTVRWQDRPRDAPPWPLPTWLMKLRRVPAGPIQPKENEMGLISKNPEKGVGSGAAKAGKSWITGGKATGTSKTIFGGRVSTGKETGKQ